MARRPDRGFQLRVEIRGLEEMDATMKRQLPWATKKALDRTAFAARHLQASHLQSSSSVFTIRSTWLSRGMRVKKARKHDWPRTFAIVGNTREFADFHVSGGRRRKRGPRHKGTVVPVAARERRTQKLRPSTFPSRKIGRFATAQQKAEQINKAAPQGSRWFAAELPSGDVGVFFRDRGTELGTRKRKRLKRSAKLWWVLRSEVQIPKRWRFGLEVAEVVRKRWPGDFEFELERALRTAKRPR